MPDELAGQDTPAVPSEVQTPEPAQTKAGTDAPVAETEGTETETPNEPKKITLTEQEWAEKLEHEKAKAAAKAERKAFREARALLVQTNAPQTQQQPEDQRPQRQQFASEEAYEDAVYDWRRGRDEKVQMARSQEDQIRSNNAKAEKLYAEVEKISGMDRDDIDEVVTKFTPVIAQALWESDVSAKLFNHLASHQDELQRIAVLSPARQAAEIGKLETKLANTAKPPKTPAPIDPVGGGQSPMKSLSTMSADEYYAARLKQRPAWAR